MDIKPTQKPTQATFERTPELAAAAAAYVDSLKNRREADIVKAMARLQLVKTFNA